VIQGMGRTVLFNQYSPTFVWDPLRGIAAGKGLEGDGNFKFTLVDADARPTTEHFSVWNAGNERFEVVSLGTNPEACLGTAGYFSDGYIQQRWTASWDAANLGFAVVAPTAAGALYQDTGVKPDIIDDTAHGDTTVLDTSLDLVNDVVVERSNTGSTSFQRVFQILIKSETDLSPETNVTIGINTTAGTRTTSTTWCRKLPGSRGWWAIFYIASLATPLYLSVKAKANTGRWFLSCPMVYNKWLSTENTLRAPIPAYTGSLTESRGQLYVKSTNAELAMRPNGWLAMSIVMPEPSVSNGHVDYAGVGQYKSAYLFDWLCGIYTIRVFMSETYDTLAVWIYDNVPTTIAYLSFPITWEVFNAFGAVVTWRVDDWYAYAHLFVNGIKVDSAEAVPLDPWIPSGLAKGDITIGTQLPTGGTSAECFISKVALGSQVMEKRDAKILSSYMYDIARGKTE
jgi:hypothetical protein